MWVDFNRILIIPVNLLIRLDSWQFQIYIYLTDEFKLKIKINYKIIIVNAQILSLEASIENKIRQKKYKEVGDLVDR